MPESLTIIAIVSFIATAVWSLILREAHDLMPLGAAWLVRRIAAMTPGDQEERDLRAQIWENDLANAPGKLYKLMWALRLLPAPWTLWRDEYECSPAILALAVWSRRTNLNYWLTIFPPDAHSLTPATAGPREMLRLAVEQRHHRFPTLTIMHNIQALPQETLKNGLIYMVKTTPAIHVNYLVSRLVDHPTIGVPSEHRHRINELLPSELQERMAQSVTEHREDPLYQSLFDE